MRNRVRYVCWRVRNGSRWYETHFVRMAIIFAVVGVILFLVVGAPKFELWHVRTDWFFFLLSALVGGTIVVVISAFVFGLLALLLLWILPRDDDYALRS